MFKWISSFVELTKKQVISSTKNTDTQLNTVTETIKKTTTPKIKLIKATYNNKI